MSFFHGARHFTIDNSNFYDIENNYHGGPTGIDILLEASIPDSAVDAESRQYAPVCFPGTREQYIHDITHWATAPDNEGVLPIYWMRGPAGVGKSAIAQTCAEKVKDAGSLGASFFFSINRRDDHKRFFTTLAYQLSAVLPSFREILNDKVYRDRTLVNKKISSQFKSLIVEPLQELERQGRGVGRRVIFIDGLDECSNRSPQSEIIEVIAASVLSGATPLRWAFFSRPEAHIVAAFEKPAISRVTYSVLLPISRDTDGELEIYLRGGFENILRRRNLPPSTGWPADESIRKLVVASAGLYAYPAAVLRYIDNRSLHGIEDALRDVLCGIPSHGTWTPRTGHRFPELDALYTLIMERIPEDTLTSASLLLAHMAREEKSVTHWFAAILSNGLGFSEMQFKAICHQLSAVIDFSEPSRPLGLYEGLDLSKSYFEQESPPRSMTNILGSYGIVRFHHKSFYDFLVDPERSGKFCVLSPSVQEQFFIRQIELQEYYAQAYAVSDSDLVLPSNLSNSSISLFWPRGNEFVDSCVKFATFRSTSWTFSHDGTALLPFLEKLPKHTLRRLIDVDYRKYLFTKMLRARAGLLSNNQHVLGRTGKSRTMPGVEFSCLSPESFSGFDPNVFLTLVEKLHMLGVIKILAYQPTPITSSTTTPTFSPVNLEKGQSRRRGQYMLGYGNKSVYWFWEFDLELRYFHQFRALDFASAMMIYETEKFRIWDDNWPAPPMHR